ncbi:hypothetical protein CC78DRAFT_584467 [Lojkania enalia]|uniref:Uncharacterized protein n=1 Tax=Lojkania enalia TaxID=147567 RepID=A0A9P4K2P7_9PLEO|nr:hypothetical protein CC78DRAFT_584467 [Didymosphaeria enalia]
MAKTCSPKCVILSHQPSNVFYVIQVSSCEPSGNVRPGGSSAESPHYAVFPMGGRSEAVHPACWFLLLLHLQAVNRYGGCVALAFIADVTSRWGIAMHHNKTFPNGTHRNMTSRTTNISNPSPFMTYRIFYQNINLMYLMRSTSMSNITFMVTLRRLFSPLIQSTKTRPHVLYVQSQHGSATFTYD